MRRTFEQALVYGERAERLVGDLLPGVVVYTGRARAPGGEGGGLLYHAGAEGPTLPDILQLGQDGRRCWFEVKAKRAPGYIRIQQLYTQAIDLHLMRQYTNVQMETGTPVVIVVVEETGPDGPGHVHCCTVKQAMRHGQAQPGMFGEGKPGWWWPRHVMWPLLDHGPPPKDSQAELGL